MLPGSIWNSPRPEEEVEMYIHGLFYYIWWINPLRCGGYCDIVHKEIFPVAITSLYLGSPYPLVQLDNFLDRQGDQYFWLYMAHDQELFDVGMELALVRSRDIPLDTLKTVDVTSNGIELLPIDGENLLSRRAPAFLEEGKSTVRLIEFDAPIARKYYFRFTEKTERVNFGEDHPLLQPDGFIVNVESHNPLNVLTNNYNQATQRLFTLYSRYS